MTLIRARDVAAFSVRKKSRESGRKISTILIVIHEDATAITFPHNDGHLYLLLTIFAFINHSHQRHYHFQFRVKTVTVNITVNRGTGNSIVGHSIQGGMEVVFG